MRSKPILSMLAMTAAVLAFAFSSAEAGFPQPPGILIPPGLPGSSVNVHVDGYLPAPPGVNVMIDSGRPYYVQSDRRVYIERDSRRWDKHGHYKKEKKYKEKHGNKNGHYKEDKGGRGGHEGGGHEGGGHGR
jgi:hypothetical protein